MPFRDPLKLVIDTSSFVMDSSPPCDHAPKGAITVSVCTVCKSADGGTPTGPALVEALREAIGDNAEIRAVQCLGVCKRPATVAITSADGYTFLFGDLVQETATPALASFVQFYRLSNYGLVPWRERAEVLRKGMVARIPPLHWSPDDGRAPT